MSLSTEQFYRPLASVAGAHEGRERTTLPEVWQMNCGTSRRLHTRKLITLAWASASRISSALARLQQRLAA